MNPYSDYFDLTEDALSLEQQARREALSCAKGVAQVMVVSRMLDGPVKMEHTSDAGPRFKRIELRIARTVIDPRSFKHLKQRLKDKGFTVVKSRETRRDYTNPAGRISEVAQTLTLMYTGAGNVMIFDGFDRKEK